MVNCKEETCLHEESYHANPEEHVSKTSHCTAYSCKCTELKK